MKIDNFFAELKRRNVYKVAVAYAVIAWLLIQAASILFPTFEAPTWVMKVFVALVALGFPIALVIAWAFEITPEGVTRTDQSSHAPTQRAGRVWIYVVLVGAAFSLGLFFLGRYTAGNFGAGSPATGSEKSIAVLPLVNQSGDASQEYFSDGLSEELINVLGQIRELRVIGRNSSFRFKGKTDDSRVIGQALRVANLLEGSVRKAGDRVRISVQLVDTANDSQRWSETYNRELKDIFAVQQEIAKAVADQLRVRLLGSLALASSKPSNENLTAYNAFLQGKYYFEKASVNDAAKGLAFLDEAIRLDPNYAEAYLLKARTLYFIAIAEGVPGRENFEKARAAVQAALAIKPDLPGAHATLSYIYLFADWNLPAAESEIAIEKEKTPTVLNNLRNLRVIQGRLEEALELNKETVRLEPLHAVFWVNLGGILTRVHSLDDAEAALRKALELQPTTRNAHAFLAIIAILRGDKEAALREAQLEPTGPTAGSWMALAYFARGEQQKADAALEEYIRAAGDRRPSQVAAIHAFRQEPDKMFEWLDRAYQEREPALISTLAIVPFFSRYYSDPRFVALCHKIGMPVPK